MTNVLNGEHLNSELVVHEDYVDHFYCYVVGDLKVYLCSIQIASIT